MYFKKYYLRTPKLIYCAITFMIRARYRNGFHLNIASALSRTSRATGSEAFLIQSMPGSSLVRGFSISIPDL